MTFLHANTYLDAQRPASLWESQLLAPSTHTPLPHDRKILFMAGLCAFAFVHKVIGAAQLLPHVGLVVTDSAGESPPHKRQRASGGGGVSSATARQTPSVTGCHGCDHLPGALDWLSVSRDWEQAGFIISWCCLHGLLSDSFCHAWITVFTCRAIRAHLICTNFSFSYYIR